MFRQGLDQVTPCSGSIQFNSTQSNSDPVFREGKEMVAEVPRCDHVCTRMQLPSPHPQLKLIMISSFRVWATFPLLLRRAGQGALSGRDG